MIDRLGELVGEHDVDMKMFERQIRQNQERIISMEKRHARVGTMAKQRGRDLQEKQDEMAQLESQIAEGNALMQQSATTRPGLDRDQLSRALRDAEAKRQRLDREAERMTVQVEKLDTFVANLAQRIPIARNANAAAMDEYELLENDLEYLQMLQADARESADNVDFLGRDELDALESRSRALSRNVEQAIAGAETQVEGMSDSFTSAASSDSGLAEILRDNAAR